MEPSVLLREWGLIDLQKVIVESKFANPATWKQIPEEILTDDLGMNKQQVEKWKTGLRQYGQVRSSICFCRKYIITRSLSDDLQARYRRQKWAEFWLRLCETDRKIIDSVWGQTEDIMRLMDFQNEKDSPKFNKGFVERVWDSDPTTFYVECLCSLDMVLPRSLYAL